QASDGNFYGAGSLSLDRGTIFRVTPSGQFTILQQFQYGIVVTSNLLQASDGNLWGLSDFRNGSFFAVTLGGASLTSGAFNCNTTGCQPQGMIEGRDGNFYGTAINGGTSPGNSEGTVFKIAAGLGRHL